LNYVRENLCLYIQKSLVEVLEVDGLEIPVARGNLCISLREIVSQFADFQCISDFLLDHIVTQYVTNVKRTKSILLSKEKLCLYIHESLEHHGSLWKLMIANTSGGGGGE
jgi:hypothetical protein